MARRRSWPRSCRTVCECLRASGCDSPFGAQELIPVSSGHVNSPHIAGWQLIYMVAGLLTVITAPFVYLLLDSDVMSARFLSDADKLIAVERLRANQTGTGVYVFKWKQIREMVLDLKTYLWFAISALLNVGASVTGAFGPTLIKNFGFNQFVSDPTDLMSPLTLASFTVLVLNAPDRLQLTLPSGHGTAQHPLWGPATCHNHRRLLLGPEDTA